jgi:hypothetical protein
VTLLSYTFHKWDCYARAQVHIGLRSTAFIVLVHTCAIKQQLQQSSHNLTNYSQPWSGSNMGEKKKLPQSYRALMT